MDLMKKIMMCASFIFSVIFTAVSAWLASSLPAGEDASLFKYCSIFFLAVSIWFGYNVYNLLRSK